MEKALQNIETFKQYLAEGFNSLEFVKYLEIVDDLKDLAGNFKNSQHKATFLDNLQTLEDRVMEGKPNLMKFPLNSMESVTRAELEWLNVKKQGGRRRSKRSRKRTTRRRVKSKNRRKRTRRTRRKTRRSRY